MQFAMCGFKDSQYDIQVYVAFLILRRIYPQILWYASLHCVSMGIYLFSIIRYCDQSPDSSSDDKTK